MRPRGALALVAAATALTGGPTAAEGSDFIPKPVENGAYLDIFASHERDTNTYGSNSSRWSDDFLREKLTVFSNGFVYHPRFLLYQVSLAGALKQEDYEASFLEEVGWTSSSGVEYDTRLLFLSEHPYNLELYAQRYEPLFKEQSSVQRNSVESGYGAMFRYRLRPFFFDARFSDDKIDSGPTESDVTRLGLNGEYFKRFESGNQYTLTAAHNPSRFSNSMGLEGSATEQYLTNVVDLRRIKLSVTASRNVSDQDNPSSGGLENDQLGFYELLTAYLPAGFRTDLSYRIHDNDSTIRDPFTSAERDLSDLSEDFELDVVHKLYQSLDSLYRFLKSDRTSINGESTAVNNLLVFNYTKAIPRGRVLAGLNFGRGETDNEGQTDVVNEPHPNTPIGAVDPNTPGLGSNPFVLGQPNVDPGSIEVFLRNPLPPFDAIRLVEQIHYVVMQVGNQIEINVLTLPPQFAVPGAYDLFVTYSLLGGDFVLSTSNFGYNASVQLLDDLLTPYFGYATVRSEEESGTFPGIPLDSTSYTAGMLVHHGPVRGRAEYQRVDWDVSPYRSWRAEVQVVSNLDATSRLYASATYLNKYFSEGTSSSFDDPYTEATTTASGSFQKQLLSRSMLAAAGGSYTQLEGLVDTVGYSLNANLSWRVGLLDLTLGASAYTSYTEGAVPVTSERSDQYYYLKVRRSFY